MPTTAASKSANAVLRAAIRKRFASAEREFSLDVEFSAGPVSYTHLDVYKRQVQSRERFVEQKHAGISHESSGQRDALTFSTGDFRWQLLAQVVDAELVQHGCDSLFPGGSRQMREPIFGILLSRQMWKQSEILQYVSDFSLGD